MLVLLTIITLLLRSKFSATNLCVKDVSSSAIELRDRIADVLISMEENATDMQELDNTEGESKLFLILLMIIDKAIHTAISCENAKNVLPRDWCYYAEDYVET